MAKNLKQTTLDTKKIGIQANGGAGLIRSLPFILITGAMLGLNAMGLFQNFSLFGTEPLGQVFSGSAGQIAWNVGWTSVNGLLYGGFVLPTLFTSINKIRSYNKYKAALKFDYNKELSSEEYDLSKTEHLINDVLAGINGLSTSVASELEIAVDKRNKLYNTNKAKFISRYLRQESAIRQEDYIKLVVIKLTDRLAELCHQRQNGWQTLTTSGLRRKTAIDESVKEKEIKAIQKFLFDLVNKTPNVDPYISTLIHQVKKHSANIELISIFDETTSSEKAAIQGNIDFIRRGKAKDAIYDCYNNSPNYLEDSTVSATSAISALKADRRLIDINAINDRAKRLTNDIANMKLEASQNLDDIREFRTLSQIDRDKILDIVIETQSLLRGARSSSKTINNIITRAENRLNAFDLKEKTINGIMDEITTELDRTTLARTEAELNAESAEANAGLAKYNAEQTKKSKEEASQLVQDIIANKDLSTDKIRDINTIVNDLKTALTQARTDGSEINSIVKQGRKLFSSLKLSEETSKLILQKIIEDVFSTAELKEIAKNNAKTTEENAEKSKTFLQSAIDRSKEINDTISKLEISVTNISNNYTNLTKSVETVSATIKNINNSPALTLTTADIKRMKNLMDTINQAISVRVDSIDSKVNGLTKDMNDMSLDLEFTYQFLLQKIEDLIANIMASDFEKEMRDEISLLQKKHAELEEKLNKIKTLPTKPKNPELDVLLNKLKGYIAVIWDTQKGSKLPESVPATTVANTAKAKTTHNVKNQGGKTISYGVNDKPVQKIREIMKTLAIKEAELLSETPITKLTLEDAEKYIAYLEDACKKYNSNLTTTP